MRILESRVIAPGVNFIVAAGTSDETKPTAGICTGSRFEEVDTGKTYKFAEGDSPDWYDQNPTPDAEE